MFERDNIFLEVEVLLKKIFTDIIVVVLWTWQPIRLSPKYPQKCVLPGNKRWKIAVFPVTKTSNFYLFFFSSKLFPTALRRSLLDNFLELLHTFYRFYTYACFQGNHAFHALRSCTTFPKNRHKKRKEYVKNGMLSLRSGKVLTPNCRNHCFHRLRPGKKSWKIDRNCGDFLRKC